MIWLHLRIKTKDGGYSKRLEMDWIPHIGCVIHIGPVQDEEDYLTLIVKDIDFYLRDRGPTVYCEIDELIKADEDYLLGEGWTSP